MFMMDEDGVHPLIGAIFCDLAVIHIRKANFTEAEQCLQLAEKQFQQIQREMLADGNFTQELIGKGVFLVKMKNAFEPVKRDNSVNTYSRI